MLNDIPTRRHTIGYIAVHQTADIKRQEVSRHHIHRDRLQHLRSHRLQRNTHNFTALYRRIALDHCNHTC